MNETQEETPVPMNTYLLHTKAHQDKRVSENLTAKGYSIFFPQAKTLKKKKGQLSLVSEALFPSYVFVEMELTDHRWLDILHTNGVRDFLRFAHRPAIVDRAIVNQIKSQMTGGFIEINAKKFELVEGNVVRITEGPMKNLQGIFKQQTGEQRSLILVKLLSEESPVHIDTRYLEKL